MKRKQSDRPSIVRRALEARSQLDALLTHPGYVRRVVGEYVQMMNPPNLRTPQDVATLAGKWRLSIRVGEVYAVGYEMFHVVEQAANDLPDDYIAEHHHLHAEHGFLWLPERLVEPLASGNLMPEVDLLTWHHGTGSTRRYKDGSTGPEHETAGVEINLWIRSSGEGGERLWLPVGSDFLPYGLPSLGWRMHGYLEDGEELGVPETQLSMTTRFVLALQMLMRQELPALSQWAVPRSDVPGLRRAQLPTSPVTVIDLRKRAHRDHPDAPEASGRHLTQRHIVRGHWARYWVGPTHEQHPGWDAPGVRDDGKAAIYLYRMAHVRGPDDAPLAITPQRVHAVRR